MVINCPMLLFNEIFVLGVTTDSTKFVLELN